MKTAEEVIIARHQRLSGVPDDFAVAAWLRELTDEVTRLRFEMREHLSPETPQKGTGEGA